MLNERIQRQIDRLLDEAEGVAGQGEWIRLRELAQRILTLDPESPDAQALLAAAERGIESRPAGGPALQVEARPDPGPPSSFVNGRYRVKRFLGEGGKKKVYLAHDTLLDRDVAFALIKTEGLDEAGAQRIQREAQAMGRLGTHPNIVSVFDLGAESQQPFIVTELMGGGDVEALIDKADQRRLALDRAIQIAVETCRGLEFAHQQGIIHRDLKPGNIWLTADGRAKIGDFGLAVAIDRTRLTQAGMMVGTVSYMPPEQAMGGLIGCQSDLYSLGCMLYEMVTGRPPFVGDESVAIIGQHLNTPPVAPIWHRPDCPAVLDALILRLLEKDPSKRPVSASDVCARLESILATGAVSATAARGAGTAVDSALPTNSESPLYRRTFVGRDLELKQLQSAFDHAMSGNASLVMVVGEPGIGKTALCEQLATYVSLRGGQALTGHCYEEGSLSLPYLAVIEAMRSYILTHDQVELRRQLGSGAREVAQIIPELRENLGVELRPPGDPEEDRWRLLQAVTSFLENAAAVQPLLIVLEDLHWADRGTLDLLVHIGRNLRAARLMVVGSYRDVEVDRSHPLSSAMGELRRSESIDRVLLRGLSVDEVHRMIGFLAGQETRWSLAEAVHRQTEGNPLFTQELLRYLFEEGLLTREAGRWQDEGRTRLETSIPEGLRDVIGKRLSRLGDGCNRLLSVAAVIGRDFRLDVLQRVAGLHEEEVIRALEEAKRAAVVEERSSVGAVITYRFSHAFFCQTLLEEISAPRRIRLHQRIGSTLEDVYTRRLDDHAAELAEHFSHSSDPADLQKAVRYGELAAQRATAVFDFGEAARFLERALEVHDILDLDDGTTRCDLLLRLGDALQLSGEPLRAAEYAADEAWRIADGLDDGARAFRAIQIGLLALFRVGAGPISVTPGYQKWLDRSDTRPPSNPADKVFANTFRAMRAYFTDRRQLRPLVTEALAIARQLGDTPSLFLAAWPAFLPRTPEDEPERLKLLHEMTGWPRDGIPSRVLSSASAMSALAFLGWGQREAAEELWQREADRADRFRDPTALYFHSYNGAIRAWVDGQLLEALRLLEISMNQAEDTGTVAAARLNAEFAARPALLSLGRFEEALELNSQTWSGFGPLNHEMNAPFEALILASSGKLDEASQVLKGFRSQNPDVAFGDLASIPTLSTQLQTAVLLGDQESARILIERLRPVAPMTMVMWDLTCVARHLGAAAALLDRPDEARQRYNEALEACGRIRFRPEVASTRLQLAELLFEHFPGERAVAIDHLDSAIAEFREMKMQPSLERALRHREVLKA